MTEAIGSMGLATTALTESEMRDINGGDVQDVGEAIGEALGTLVRIVAVVFVARRLGLVKPS